uniref:ABC transporter permease n=1 Tax=Alsidium seaforthii TaxID=2007182 RepID=A0A1Z1MCP8_9FLOR|nr:hypothetical protein [Bryothamnion seaforthii]ARW63867.1 hypothetical protein [Bryothamnion seaforthii]
MFVRRILLFIKVLFYLLYDFRWWQTCRALNVVDQIKLVGINSLFIVMITSFFISLVFTLQVVKEFMYLNAIDLIGSIVSIAFIRELSPVLTSIIFVGKVCSFFTSELATMLVTEQIDALFILGINPINYLIFPRLISVLVTLPLLNLFSILTSLITSSFICFILYSIDPLFFIRSLFYSSLIIDLSKSLIKVLVFAFFISLISCIWGLTAQGGSKGVGLSTTSSVVTCLISIFILNFILSYCLFNNFVSSFQMS